MSAQPASWLALAATLLLVLMVFVWRPLLQRRHGPWGWVLLVLPLLLVGQALVAIRFPHALGLAEADLRAPAPLRTALGALLMFGGLLLQGAAMLGHARPGLVTERFYRYAPIDVPAGYMLLIPTLLSALILAA
ncbi:MAG TPA: hypothetical protein VJQ58_15470, partial [Burkholderiales bacterium]|nr:hypothetical protein [Burkholderiales bacterium]